MEEKLFERASEVFLPNADRKADTKPYTEDDLMKLLEVPRSSFYYKGHREFSRVASDEQAKDEIMNIYENMPFYGVPRLTAELNRRGYRINHKRVRRLKKSMGLRTVYPRPHFNTSEPHPEHEKFPYLLCKLEGSTQIRYGVRILPIPPLPNIGRL